MKLEELKKLSEDQLAERFPFMRIYRMYEDRFTTPDDFEDKTQHTEFIDWGWRDIQLVWAEHIREELKKIPDSADKFYITEVKEKHGGIRIYTSFTTDGISKWTNLAEHISYYTCIECGKSKVFGRKAFFYQTRGWICPYCKEHIGKNDYKRKWVTRDAYLRSYTDKWHTIKYKAKDFWKLEDD